MSGGCDRLEERLEEGLPGTIGTLYFVRDNRPVQHDIVGDALIVRGESDQRWVHLVCPRREDMEPLLERLVPEDRCFAQLRDWMVPELLREREPLWTFTALRLLLPPDAPRITVPGVAVGPLDPGEAGLVRARSTYSEYMEESYVRSRIARGLSACVRVGGEPVAWAMTHDDSAIGFLHVLERWRGRGYARAVTADLVRRLREMGRIPFVQIEEDNRPSLSLAAGLGFVPEGRVSWLETAWRRHPAPDEVSAGREGFDAE